MKKIVILFLMLFCVPPRGHADVQIKSGASTDTATVNSNKAILTADGKSSLASYTANIQSEVTTAAILLSLEAPAGQAVRVVRICTASSVATAAAAVTVVVQRRTTASTGGTVVTNEATASDAISKRDPADGSFGGIVRNAGTAGTAGAVLDAWSFTAGELGAGVADPPSMNPFCKEYGERGMKPIIISAGVSNGISVNVSSHGAGGLASGLITIDFYVE
jgi:hypothetical protein